LHLEEFAVRSEFKEKQEKNITFSVSLISSAGEVLSEMSTGGKSAQLQT